MNLAEYAKTIPSMGGRQIGSHIREAVRNLSDDMAIVELGTWMGAGTAQIALELIDQGKKNPVYTYDRFIVSGRQPLKAEKEGMTLIDKEDSYEKVKKVLAPFPINLTIIKKEIKKSEYHGEKIGLYIDDACKQESNFLETRRIFWRHFIPGVTICIFMDYYLYKKTGSEKHRFQHDYISARPNEFEHIKDVETSYWDGEEFGAVFRYLGGYQ